MHASLVLRQAESTRFAKVIARPQPARRSTISSLAWIDQHHVRLETVIRTGGNHPYQTPRNHDMSQRQPLLSGYATTQPELTTSRVSSVANRRSVRWRSVDLSTLTMRDIALSLLDQLSCCFDGNLTWQRLIHASRQVDHVHSSLDRQSRARTYLAFP
ncbi:hypothetical protein LIPSTDRAFT_279396 [Lipomyces starkeyi NRRL Y-11557]|uniref:Uncharacterized protein n=1 Tax=Lipomyces starkeyi NRRL Y-11557 TaxID=675824 RepID=A0A1E3Q5M6_LIPST|nr:hypothetical protein LIPSTDRAFT_279396 [Lipomyces starkeyi NRRL Y-11557]